MDLRRPRRRSSRCGGRTQASYDAFGEHLTPRRRLPDLPAVAAEPGLGGHRLRRGRRAAGRGPRSPASPGTSALDGPVDVLVVSEEPGTGLGARCAGTLHSDPGLQIAASSPTAQDPGRAPSRSRSGRLHVGRRPRPSTAACSRARPPAAGCGWCSARPRRCCCCATTGSSRDVSGLGPQLLEVPVRGPPARLVTVPGPRLRWCASTSTPTRARATAPTRLASWCTPRRRRDSTCSRSPTTTPATAGPRPPSGRRGRASRWSAGWRSAPGWPAASGVHLLAYLPDPTYPPLARGAAARSSTAATSGSRRSSTGSARTAST